MAAATTTKLTQEQRIEKLMSLHVGSRVQWQGKNYTVLTIKERGGKLCRRDVRFLEDGKPEYYYVEGSYHAAGKMIRMSNVEFRTMYARPMYMDFEIVG